MSQQESNVCSLCGGLNRVEYVITFAEARPCEVRIVVPDSSSLDWHLCPGHPKPEQRHGGFLDEMHEYEVSYWQKESSCTRIYIEETNDTKDEPEFVAISPHQALSLFEWLAQEKATLEQMVKEQDRG